MRGAPWRRLSSVAGLCAAVLGLACPAAAELVLPAGFTSQPYVSGEGFDTGAARGVGGIPSTSTLVFDDAGNLYLARSGRRYWAGEADDLAPIYRIPVGGARLTPDTEARYLHGPPLRSPQVGTIRNGHELFVTTFDRDRRVGVLYRMLDGRAALFAGGTPPRGTAPLFRQPEGVAVDTGGRLYVADRVQGTVILLDPAGRVLDPGYVQVTRPRVLAMDAQDHLWIGADGNAEAPWQQGPGEIWRVGPGGVASMLHRGPIAASIAASSAGVLFVADRQGARIFGVTPEGDRFEFATFTGGDAPRSLRFAPLTPETQRAGIAGDLFVVTISRGAWPVNEVVRVSGPFPEFLRGRPATR